VTKDLVVEVGRTDLVQILSASQRIVFVADVGDEDETGWRPVKAMSLEYIPQKSRSHTKLEQIADRDNLDDDDEDYWPNDDQEDNDSWPESN
jgi:hypothetical protein